MKFFQKLLEKLVPAPLPREFRIRIYGLSGEFIKTTLDEKFQLSTKNRRAVFRGSDGYCNELMVRVRMYPDRVRINYIEQDLNLASCSRGVFREFPIRPGMVRTFKPRHMTFTLEEFQPGPSVS